LNLGLESRRNRFGAAIVKTVLFIILRCRLRMDVPDRESSLWTPRGLLLGLSVAPSPRYVENMWFPVSGRLTVVLLG
jgi:hypothetical protein